MRLLIKMFLFCVITLVASQTYCAIIYDENVNGDLPSYPVTYPTFKLSVGDNEVYGEEGPTDYGDNFFIDLTDGLRLDSVILINISGFPTAGVGFNLIYNDSNKHYSAQRIPITFGTDILPELTDVYGPGYALPIQDDIAQVTILGGEPTQYGFNFVVSAVVPLPAGLPVYLSGLVLISVLRITSKGTGLKTAARFVRRCFGRYTESRAEF